MNFMEKITDQNKKELSEFIRTNKRTAEEIKRAQAILMLSEGVSDQMVYALTDLKRATVVKLRKKYIKQGLSSLESKRKDKKPRALLTKSQRLEITDILSSKSPRDYGWSWDYWIPSILGELILELYGVKYKSKTSLYLIFKQSKFTYHNPEKIYVRRNQEKIDQWKKDTAPLVQEALQDPETIVLVEDEMIVTSQTTLQKIWFPEGFYPFIKCSNTRKRKSFYGFLNINTGEQMAFKSEKQTSEISANFLKKVIKHYKDKKILLLWDNAPWHRGQAMRNFLTTCKNLHIINFPPYAPDENPQEHVWKAARAETTHNQFIPDIEKTARKLLDYLNNSIFKYKFFGFTAS